MVTVGFVHSRVRQKWHAPRARGGHPLFRVHQGTGIPNVMTLRARISAVAGLAVALAVLIAATSLYAAVRSDLRSEVDKSLRQRAATFAPPPSAAGRATTEGTSGPPDGSPPPSGLSSGGAPPPQGGLSSHGAEQSSGHDDAGGGFPNSVEPAPLGGPSGYVQFVSAEWGGPRACGPGHLDDHPTERG